MLVTAFNPVTDDLEKTFLSQSYVAGLTSIQVKNNQAFSNNTRIMIGELGFAQTEIVNCGTPNADGMTLPISATLYSHPANTPVYLLQFDEVQFYRSTAGSNGTYTLLVTVPVDVTNENLTTSYDDTSAQAGYYYEVAMYNSLTAVTSALSDPIPAVTGWPINTVGYLIDELLTEVNDPTEENITRDEIMAYFNECNDDMLMNAVRPYNFLRQRSVYARVGGASTLNYPSNMWKFERIDYNYQSSTTNPVTNVTYTVEVVDLPYFRNRHIMNTSSLAAPTITSITVGSGGQLAVNTPYYYVVTAVYSTSGESGGSAEVTATTNVGNQTITLVWGAQQGASQYNIYRGTASGGEVFITSVTAPTVTYADNGTIIGSSITPPPNYEDDYVQEIALNETMQQFDYFPNSATSANAVWYVYYWQYFTQLTTEAQAFQTPTTRIYKAFVKWMYYTKRSVAQPSYLQIAQVHHQEYILERSRLKSQDRRDIGTPRRFEGEGWVRRSFRR